MKIQYRRKLPHKFFPGYTFFITWNLKGAIPHTILAPMIRERDLLLDQLEISTHLSPDEKAAAIYDIKQKFFITPYPNSAPCSAISEDWPSSFSRDGPFTATSGNNRFTIRNWCEYRLCSRLKIPK